MESRWLFFYLFLRLFTAIRWTRQLALSNSPLFVCRDGTVRDLAGLRGTYRIIDKTELEVRTLLQTLDGAGIRKAVVYLDALVSNSGRLSTLILEIAQGYQVQVEIEIINDVVYRVLQTKSGVITSDVIILDYCTSWINLMPEMLRDMEQVWLIDVIGRKEQYDL